MTTARFVTLPSGVRLSYADTGGASDPTIVALPGPTDSWRSYQQVLDQLPSGIRMIAASQRGHGDSDKPAAGYRVQDFAADVVPLLDALDVGRAWLAGHSGSCFVARRVALDHPERVAGLILEASPTALGGHPGLVDFVDDVVASLGDPVDEEFARSWVADTSSDDLDPALLDELVDEVCKVPGHVWRETFSGLLAYDDRHELGRLGAPALLVWGDQDRLVSREMQDELTRCISHAHLAVHDGAGHTPRWDDPARFVADVAAFVRSVEPDR